MEKEELLLAKRFADLSRQAQQKNIVVFSDFLNLNELNIFRQQIPSYILVMNVLAAMDQVSVRWLHFYLMLFVMTGTFQLPA